ncbi:MAG: kelch repeat-containing protein [Acidobacteriaceae bacterium]
MAASKLLSCRRSALFFLPMALLLAICAGCGASGGNSSNNGGGGTTGGGGGGTAPPPPASNANLWAWMGGSNTTPYLTVGPAGVYGTEGVGSTSNVPGGREGAGVWTDVNGNFWLFGGHSVDENGVLAYGNDLWEYVPSKGTWTWMSGANVLSNQTAGPIGVYGTIGIPSTTNVPGGRVSPVTWSDSSGNLWLFGGAGVDSIGSEGSLNDLWEFSPSTKTWTWIGGSSVVGGPSGESDAVGQPSMYGTKGTPSTTNFPGGRWKAVSWIDSKGDLWLFGGFGANLVGSEGDLDDLWEFDPTDKTWTWISGSSASDVSGAYGIQNVASPSNVPGARDSAISWVDHSGHLWLFGGYGRDANGTLGVLNDLWQFNLADKTWTWVSGSNSVGNFGEGQSGVYGTQGVAAAGNMPGGRDDAVSWTDGSGNLWLFGGYGVDSNPPPNGMTALNDLWEFDTTQKMWTWVSGDKVGNDVAIYGMLGTASASSIPSGRTSATSWLDTDGNLWLFGGWGVNSQPAINHPLNDLWRYTP